MKRSSFSTDHKSKRLKLVNDQLLTCSLCGKETVNKEETWSLHDRPKSSTKATFSSILRSIFKEKNVKESKHFFTGVLCKKCKDDVSSVEDLQSKILKVEESLIDTLKNSRLTENRVNEEEKQASPFHHNSHREQEEDFEPLEVENIIARRIGRCGKPEYLVKWKNYDRLEYNTWEKENCLEEAKDIVQKFEAAQRSKQIRMEKENEKDKRQ